MRKGKNPAVLNKISKHKINYLFFFVLVKTYVCHWITFIRSENFFYSNKVTLKHLIEFSFFNVNSVGSTLLKRCEPDPWIFDANAEEMSCSCQFCNIIQIVNIVTAALPTAFVCIIFCI